nr:putative transposase (putative), gypsy type [Tanacetum cinerariifolium]
MLVRVCVCKCEFKKSYLLEMSEASFYRSQILGFLSILLVIVSGQCETLFRKGSAYNRGCGHRLPSAYVLRKCLICVRLETSGRSQLISRLSGSSYHHINISQLSVIAAAKVSHFEILCRVHNIEPTVGLFYCFYVNSRNKGWMSFSKSPNGDAVYYTKLMDSLKHWNDHFFWVDSFACHASFPCHTGKNISRDPFPKSTEFNADDYAILVARPTPFRKFPKPFLCLIGISYNYTLDEDTYPTFLHDDRTGGCLPTLLDSTVGRVVFLLPVAPARAESELEGSVEKLFNKGCNADQVDSAIGGGQEAEVGIATGVRIIAEENMATERPRRLQKKRQAITDAGGSSIPHKKLKGNIELLVKPLFVINLHPPLGSCWQASYSSHHSSTHASEAEGDSFIRSGIVPLVMTEVVVTSYVVDNPLTVKADIAGPSYSAKQDLPMGSRELNSETLRQVFVLQLNFLNDSILDHYDVSREFVDHLAPLALFSCIREMDYHYLFTEFIVGTARQAFLNAEVKMRTEYCLGERKRLESKCEKKADLLKVRDAKIESLKARLLLKETEAAKVIHLRARVSTSKVMKKKHVSEIDALKQKNVAFENKKGSLDGKVVELQSLMHELEVTCCCERLSGYENLTDRLEEFQDAQLKVVNDKVAKLNADLAKMACHLEEKFYPYLLTTISGRRWLLTHGLKLVLVKCLNSSKYLMTFGAAISRSIKKRMQDGLAARIDHGREGTSLTDVAAYNPSAELDFNYALQELCKLDYPLLSELKSHKDASFEDIMNLLRLKGPHVDAPGIGALHPDIEQLKIKENIVAERVPATTITTLSTTFASASSIPPNIVDDYEIVYADGQESPQGNVQRDVATVEFENEDLDTTTECNLLS